MKNGKILYCLAWTINIGSPTGAKKLSDQTGRCMKTIIKKIFRRSAQSCATVNEVEPEPDWGLHLQKAWPASSCPWLKSGSGSMLYHTARVYNLYGESSAISLGSQTHVRGELTTFAHGGRIIIGDYCYIGEGTRIWSAKSIYIGNRVLISHNVNIYDCDTHPIDDPAARHQQFKDIITTGHPRTLNLQEKEVILEDDVLISSQCIILKGMTIGRAAVVAAGSVVTKDVPPFTLVAGNPARIVRRLNMPEDL